MNSIVNSSPTPTDDTMNVGINGIQPELYPDILRAYRFVSEDIPPEEQPKLILNLMNNHILFNTILVVIQSSRHPYEILKYAAEIGMYIPMSHRFGYKTYLFFIRNVLYYTDYLKVRPTYFPTSEEIYLHPKREEFLSTFPDTKIFQHLMTKTGNYFDYEDRQILIQRALSINFGSWGEFSIETTNKETLHHNIRFILYSDPECKLALSPDEISRGLDLSSQQLRIGWKIISPLALVQLRQVLLESHAKWKQTPGYPNSNVLLFLANKLDAILGPQKTLTNSYLNVPGL